VDDFGIEMWDRRSRRDAAFFRSGRPTQQPCRLTHPSRKELTEPEYSRGIPEVVPPRWILRAGLVIAWIVSSKVKRRESVVDGKTRVWTSDKTQARFVRRKPPDPVLSGGLGYRESSRDISPLAHTRHNRSVKLIMQRPHYCPPWADTSIIGIAGSSGSGKTSLAHAIVERLNLPWVVILSMVGVDNRSIGIAADAES
jgi:hypothetical protein